MKRSKKLGSKLIALMLTLMMVAAYVPMVGDVAYAATTFTNDTETNYSVGDFENKWGVYLATDKDTYKTGEDIHVKITGAFEGAYLGIYDTYSSDWNTTSMCGAYVSSNQDDFILYGENKDASVNKNYDLTPGTYYVTYIYSDGRYAVLPITIEGELSVVTDKTTYKYGESINVTTPYTYGSSDWVGIYKKGQTPGSETPSISWYYIKDYPNGFDITDFANSADKAVPEKQQDALFHGKLKSGEYSVKLFLNGSYTVSKQVDITIEKEPYGEPEVTPAGCEKEGSSVQWYTDGSKVETTTPALEHQWSEYVYDAETKTHSRTCSTTEHAAEVGDCIFEIDGEPVVNASGTTTTYKCTICEGTYTETVASGFEFVENVTVDATCTEDGETYELWKNKTTGEEMKVNLTVLPKKNHSWSEWTPVGENATTHERVCANDPEHKETGDCNRNEVSFKVNELVQSCDICGSEEAEAVLSMEKSIYGVDEDIIVKTNYPAVGAEGKNWIGIFFHTDGHNDEHEYPHAPAKGWVYLSSDEQEFKVNDKSIWLDGAPDKDTFINYNEKGQLMPGEWTVAIILDDKGASGQVSPYLRFTVCDHKWTDSQVLEDATCTEEGLKELTCPTCEETKTEVIPALEHDWDEGEVTKEATCEEAGSKVVTCQRDNTHTDTVVIPALGHDWEEADCDTPKTCKVCELTEGEALGHDWEEADCDTPKTCKVCELTEGEALGHDWEEADCDTPKTCKVCKLTEGEALGHDWEEADCDTPKTCKVCKLTEGEALGHAWDEGTVTTAPTCTAEGVKTFVCKHDAKHTTTEPVAIDEKAHAWDEGTVTTEATCMAEGVKTFVCKHDAKHTKTEVIPVDKDNHKFEAVVTAPTCTEKGYTTYKCACGDSYTADEKSPAGHKLTKTEAKDATCTEAGNIEYYTCNVCEGYFLDEKGEKATTAAEVVVAATGHKYGAYKTTTKAKFGKNGEQEATCSVCGDKAVKTIAAPKTIKLSYTSYTYNGKVRKPTVTVYDSNGNKISSANYKVSYASGRKNVGKYKVTVTIRDGRANYAKSSKYTTFRINPKGTSISSLTKAKKGFTVKWKKQSGKMAKTRITGYQYRYSTSSKMTNANIKTVKGYSKTSAKRTSLKANKKYYVQVRTYKVVNKTWYYSPWSKAKAVTTK